MATETPGAVAAAGGTAAAVSGPARGPGRSAGRGAAVRVRELSLRGERGRVCRDVDLDVPSGGLAAVGGIAGSGRTALLLALGGRMKTTGGTGTVGGVPLDDRRAVQRIAALGIVPGVTGLDPALTVREHVREALALHEGILGRFRGRDARMRAALDRVALDVDPRTLAGDLDPDEAQLLGAALALVGEPGLILLDDVDEGLPADRQRTLWRRLRAVADSGVTVIAACHDLAPAEGLAHVAVELP